MKPIIKSISLLIALSLLVAYLPQIAAAESDSLPVYVEIIPVKSVEVNGDKQRFQAHHWMQADNLSGGIKELMMESEFGDGYTLEFEGHLFQPDHDFGADMTLSNDELGLFRVDYQAYRKYFEDTGGYFATFGALSSIDLDSKMQLDIGELLVEFAPSLELGGFHDFKFTFAHHSKSGAKSRLTWGEVEEAASGLTRNIAPTPQLLNESVNLFKVEGATQLAGYDIRAEQAYERTKIDSRRVERDYADTGSGGDEKIRNHIQEPEARVLTTTLNGERWFDDDKAYLGFAYRYENLENEESEYIIETNTSGVPTNYGFAEQIVDAFATNSVDSHTFVGQYMKKMSDVLSFSVKSKMDYLVRDSESTYPEDNSPSNNNGLSVPDGTIDGINYPESNNIAFNWAEMVGFRYSGLKNTSIYGEAELSQEKNKLKEEERDMTRALNFERDTRAFITNKILTLGSRTLLTKGLDLTFKFQRLWESNDYDHKLNPNDASTTTTAFVDAVNSSAYKTAAKLTWKPIRKVTTSLRYQLENELLETRASSDLKNQAYQESRFLSHIFTYNLSTMPFDNTLINFSFSKQLQKTTTPSASRNSLQIPGFTGNVNTATVSGSYFPSSELSLTTAYSQSWARNFQDLLSSTLPLGVSSTSHTGSFSMKWSPAEKNYTVEPHYAYYRYDPSSVSDVGDYSAHVAWVDISFDW